MSEIEPARREIAPSVAALLAIFHEETRHKLEIAPVESVTIRITPYGVTIFDHKGWSLDYDDLDKDDAIPVRPITVTDIEQP